MVTYIAHMPHSPALLPAVSKHKSHLFKALRAAFESVAGDMHTRGVEVVVFITPHGLGNSENHIIHYAPRYITNFRHLGRFDIRKEFSGDAYIAHLIRSKAEPAYAVKMVSQHTLDHASATAALLFQKTINFRIVPLTYALHSMERLSDFGIQLRETLENIPLKIAVIALGDLSRARESSDDARAHDSALLRALESLQPDTLQALDKEGERFNVSAVRPLAIVSGLLHDMQYAAEVLCYEQKQNVGMAVTRFCF